MALAKTRGASCSNVHKRDCGRSSAAAGSHLVPPLVADDDEDAALPQGNAVLHQRPDAGVHFLPHGASSLGDLVSPKPSLWSKLREGVLRTINNFSPDAFLACCKFGELANFVLSCAAVFIFTLPGTVVHVLYALKLKLGP